MAPRLRTRLRLAGCGVFAALLGVALSPREVAADEGAAGASACNAWDVEYTLSANLQLDETPMGKGDGVYPIGPGKVVIRFEDRGGQPSGAARMRAYSMNERFEIHSSAVFWSADVTTVTTTGTTPDACGNVAEGVLAGRNLRWITPLRGYHTDGTITCQGSLCGKFKAPPPGVSQFHVAPHEVPFSAFGFAADMKTFTMQRTYVSKTEQPQQTAYISLAGREMKRTCVQAPACGGR